LNPDQAGRQEYGKGHGTGALGPSDSSDSGSDVQGARHVAADDQSELDDHGVDFNDEELASDTDRYGTGERALADGDSTFESNGDIRPDELDDENDLADDDELISTLEAGDNVPGIADLGAQHPGDGEGDEGEDEDIESADLGKRDGDRGGEREADHGRKRDAAAGPRGGRRGAGNR
jgi:hypothetical protein